MEIIFYYEKNLQPYIEIKGQIKTARTINSMYDKSLMDWTLKSNSLNQAVGRLITFYGLLLKESKGSIKVRNGSKANVLT